MRNKNIKTDKFITPKQISKSLTDRNKEFYGPLLRHNVLHLGSNKAGDFDEKVA